ncbi:hypothetical protein ERJ70_16655 [Sediminibacillus dalangtanensis]|uniref:Uncharacterized protein n=1 Tax=Sediminibacillus dalangtanensis TaxID=2729421 RepID=A0ABX7VXK1_9BACI|nr:hypothetical protein [Sediminibacillus dalangtanensis]QTN00765.1 hypothetical protein ERJ70_16655 [Sediminibacillus dalangtanensis]
MSMMTEVIFQYGRKQAVYLGADCLKIVSLFEVVCRLKGAIKQVLQAVGIPEQV